MLVVIEFGYSKYVFPSEIIPFLNNLREVELKSVGGKTKYFLKDNSQDIKISLVNSSSFVAPDSEEEGQNYKQMCEEMEKANNDLYSRIWKEETKSRDLEAKVKALQELCPDSHKKEEPNVS